MTLVAGVRHTVLLRRLGIRRTEGVGMHTIPKLCGRGHGHVTIIAEQLRVHLGAIGTHLLEDKRMAAVLLYALDPWSLGLL
jgi:hypothetical protein